MLLAYNFFIFFLRYVGTKFYFQGKDILRIVRYITYCVLDLGTLLWYQWILDRFSVVGTFYNEDI